MIINPYQYKAAGDPLWASVSSLLNCGGADGSTTFTDEKGLTWDRYGDAQINGGQILLDGTVDCIRATTTLAYAFAAGDFCLEAFINPDSVAAEVAVVTRWQTPNSAQSFFMGVRPSGRLFFLYSTTGAYQAANDIQSSTGVIAAGVNQHVAVDRNGTTLRGFVDGVEVFSHSTGTSTISGSLLPTVGGTYSNTNLFDGKIGPVRATKASRYTSSFMPPAFGPFPNF